MGGNVERCESPRPGDRGEHHNRRKTNKSKQVPSKANAPEYDPPQQATYARSPFSNTRHDKSRQDWSEQTSDGERTYRAITQTQKPVVSEQRRQEHEPGKTEGDQEIGDQWMTSWQTARSGGRLCGCSSKRRNPSSNELGRFIGLVFNA